MAKAKRNERNSERKIANAINSEFKRVASAGSPSTEAPSKRRKRKNDDPSPRERLLERRIRRLVKDAR